MFSEGCIVSVPNINHEAYGMLKLMVKNRKAEIIKKIERIEVIKEREINEYLDTVTHSYKEELKLCEYIAEYLWYYEKDLRAKEEN